MTSLYKLSIQGVRSYDPETPCRIEFFKPLTIILGANGSGKTSIIEALKYITTGSEPPQANKGKNFVHDPDIAGTSLVKAKVMLAFRTAAYWEVVASRVMQVSKTKSKSSFKLLDSSVSIQDADGQRREMSNKCADMAKLIPGLLGVPKAILDNVIFCHQEESYWPLSEDLVLKKKFDDIFAATSYTKVLQDLKDYKQEQTKQLKEHQHQLDLLTQNVEAYDKLVEDSKKARASIESLKKEKAMIGHELIPKRQQHAELEEIWKQMLKYEKEIQPLERSLDVLLKEHESASARLSTVFEESVEEMQQYLDSQDMLLKKHQQSLNDKTFELKNIQSKISEKSEEKNELSKMLGQLEMLQKTSQDERRKAGNLVRNVLLSYSDIPFNLSRAQSNSLEWDEVRNFLKLVVQYQNNAKSSLKEQEQKFMEQKQQMEGCLEEIRAKISSLREGIAGGTTQLQSSKKRFLLLDSEINDLEKKISELSKKNLTKELSSLQSQLGALQSKDPSSTSNILELQATIEENSKKLKILSQYRLDQSMRLQEFSALVSKENEMKSLKENFDSLSSSWSIIERLENVGIKTISLWNENPNSVLERLNSVQENAREELMRLDSEIAVLRSKESAQALIIEECSSKEKSLQKVVQSQIMESQTLMSQLQLEESLIPSLGDSEVHSRSRSELEKKISSMEEELDGQKDRLSLSNSAKQLYEKFVDHAKRDKKCSVCRRGLNDSELSDFIKINSTKASLLQDRKIGELHSIIDSTQVTVNSMKKLRDFLVKVDENDGELVSLRERRLQAQKIKDELSSKLNILKERFEASQLKETLIKKCLSHLQELAVLFNNYSSAQRIVAKLSSDLKGKSEIDKELEKTSSEIERIEQDSRDLQSQISGINNSISLHQKQVSDLQKRIGIMQRDSTYYTELKASLDEKKKQHSAVQNEIAVSNDRLKNLTDELKPLESSFSEESSKMTQISQEMEAKLQKQRNAFADLVKYGTDLKVILDENEFRMSRIQELSLAQTKFESNNEEIRALSSKAKRIEEIIGEEMKKSANFENTMREIEANIAHKLRLGEIKNFQEQITVKKENFKQISKRNTSELEAQLMVLSREIESIISEESRISGSIQAQSAHLAELEVRMKDRKFENVQGKFREAAIAFEALKISLEDIGKYSRALDKALMAFHSKKMEEINQVLKQLWQATYRGKDIDHIAIRSDHADPGQRKQYSYYVVMVSGDKELPMRGRCSAGQRVLACILIRMALAETFCVNCGVLALDEPTTNLDVKNIKALADALHSIIDRRKGQKSFQLIVITHDEEFVSFLNARDHADYYYTVWKDQSHHSRIDKRLIES